MSQAIRARQPCEFEDAFGVKTTLPGGASACRRIWGDGARLPQGTAISGGVFTATERRYYKPAGRIAAITGSAPPFRENIAKYVFPSGVNTVYSMNPMSVVTFVR